MHRSGTNLLLDLLTKHPQISAHQIPEDFLVAGAGHLDAYVKAVSRRWNNRWYDEGILEGLRRAIGRGLANYLVEFSELGEKPLTFDLVATKTPSVEGLSLFRQFFPDAYLLILVRDGRAVVESGVRSFGWHFGRAARRWAEAAKTIIRFRESDTNASHTRLVRFEDLVESRDDTMREVYRFLGVDADRVTGEQLENAPVVGSSETASSGQGDVHWQPIPAPGEFSPTQRAASWSQYQHAAFNQAAGREMNALGYCVSAAGPVANLAAAAMRLVGSISDGVAKLFNLLGRRKSSVG